MSRLGKRHTLLEDGDAAAADVFGEALDVSLYETFKIILIGKDDGAAAQAILNVRLLASMNYEEPEWGDPADETNLYTFVRAYNTLNETAVNGDVGYTFSDNEVVELIINQTWARWLNIYVPTASHTSGFIDAYLFPIGDRR